MGGGNGKWNYCNWGTKSYYTNIINVWKNEKYDGFMYGFRT
jgi:hypothetical protein